MKTDRSGRRSRSPASDKQPRMPAPNRHRCDARRSYISPPSDPQDWWRLHHKDKPPCTLYNRCRLTCRSRQFHRPAWTLPLWGKPSRMAHGRTDYNASPDARAAPAETPPRQRAWRRYAWPRLELRSRTCTRWCRRDNQCSAYGRWPLPIARVSRELVVVRSRLNSKNAPAKMPANRRQGCLRSNGCVRSVSSSIACLRLRDSCVSESAKYITQSRRARKEPQSPGHLDGAARA